MAVKKKLSFTPAPLPQSINPAPAPTGQQSSQNYFTPSVAQPQSIAPTAPKTTPTKTSSSSSGSQSSQAYFTPSAINPQSVDTIPTANPLTPADTAGSLKFTADTIDPQSMNPPSGGEFSGAGSTGSWATPMQQLLADTADPNSKIRQALSPWNMIPFGKTAKVSINILVIGGKEVVANPAAVKTTKSLMQKILSPKTLAALGAAASSLFLGLWARSEAPEPLTIAMRDALQQAQRTGNYTIYNEAKEARDEILNLPLWQDIGLWTPFAPAIGIPLKLKGIKEAAVVLDKIAADNEKQLQTRETDDEKWARIKQEQSDQERANIDYYNQQRKLLLLWEEEAADRDMREDAKFYAEQRAKQFALEEEERRKIAAFWTAYRKQVQKAQDDNTPSKLSFGLL